MSLSASIQYLDLFSYSITLSKITTGSIPSLKPPQISNFAAILWAKMLSILPIISLDSDLIPTCNKMPHIMHIHGYTTSLFI